MPSESDFTLRFSRRYCMGHRLISGAAPACSVPHGHDEVVTVEIASAGNAPLNAKTNMLVEFEQVKRRWFDWIDDAVDHSFHLNEKDPLIGWFRDHEPHILASLLLTPGDPTTEIRSACFKSKLGAFLAADHPAFHCTRLTIQETPTNAVVCDCTQLDRVLPKGDHWWNRADQTINDLTSAA